MLLFVAAVFFGFLLIRIGSVKLVCGTRTSLYNWDVNVRRWVANLVNNFYKWKYNFFKLIFLFFLFSSRFRPVVVIFPDVDFVVLMRFDLFQYLPWISMRSNVNASIDVDIAADVGVDFGPMQKNIVVIHFLISLDLIVIAISTRHIKNMKHKRLDSSLCNIAS